MNIKSLLLGSAAAFAVVSGAQAADVVVAQPEPVEYVKVCDAYGAGFFYIPGTDTCIQFSGYVSTQIQGATANANNFVAIPSLGLVAGTIVDTPSYYGPNDGMEFTTRGRFNVDVRSETELGTLRGYLRYQGGYASGSVVGDIPVGLDQAFIDFLGFRIGYSESAWLNAATGGVANWGSHSWGGMYYGYQERDRIAYNFTQNGFHGTLSVEDDGNANWTPDVVGLAGYDAGWGGVWAKFGYDEDSGTQTLLTGQDAWAAGIGVQINMPNMPGSNLRVLGYYNNQDGAYGTGSPVAGILSIHGQAEWSVLASYQQQFNDKFTASAAFQYWDNFYVGDFTSTKSGINAWGAELNLVYLPVKNFEVRAELHYDKVDTISGSTSGFLRFTRYF